MQSRVRLQIFTLFAWLGSLTAQAQTIQTYTLQQALQYARAHNPGLRTEQFSVGMAQADMTTARLRPNLTLNNQTLQLTQPGHFPPNTYWYDGRNRQVWWQLTKTFQVAGQRSRKIDVAEGGLDLTQKNYAETERNLFSTVAGKWIDVWTAQKQLDILAHAKDNVDSLVYSNRIRYKNQVITQTDLFRTELLLKQYAIQYAAARQELINKQKELRFLMGVSDSVQVDTADDFLFRFPGGLDSLLSLSAQTRSDIQAARSLIDVSRRNIRLQRSLAYPQPELGLIGNPQNSVPYVGVYATIDLPFFNRNQGEIRKARLQQDQAEQHLYTLQQQLQTEIGNAYGSYQVQQRNAEQFRTVLQQSQAILDNVTYAYLRGGTTIIDFLEAQRSWLDTQQRYYDALQQYRQSYIQLLYTTGFINQLAQ